MVDNSRVSSRCFESSCGNSTDARHEIRSDTSSATLMTSSGSRVSRPSFFLFPPASTPIKLSCFWLLFPPELYLLTNSGCSQFLSSEHCRRIFVHSCEKSEALQHGSRFVHHRGVPLGLLPPSLRRSWICRPPNDRGWTQLGCSRVPVLHSKHCTFLHCDTKSTGSEITTLSELTLFQNSLLYQGDALCGGALVAPDVVLTAAHCAGTCVLATLSYHRLVPRLTFLLAGVSSPAAFHSKVLVGSYNYFLDQNSSTTFKRTVLSGTRTLHPDYDHFALRNDLMLFKIDPVPIKPAVLNLDPAAPAPGQAFTVIGFGELTPNASVTDPPEYPATLQKVRQFVVDGATCQQRWGIDADFIDNGTMICAEANSSTPSGVCGGTSTVFRDCLGLSFPHSQSATSHHRRFGRSALGQSAPSGGHC